MRWRVLLFFCTIGLIPAQFSFADTVMLTNGDRITGKVIALENNKLLVDTAFAGKISILWHTVATLETEEPVRLALESETLMVSRIKADEDGKIKISPPEAKHPLAVSLSQVVLINPPPQEPSVKLSGRMNAGMNISDGNTQTEALSLDGELVARSRTNRFTIGATYNRKEDEGVKTADNSSGYLKYDHFLSEKWYVLANVTGTRDDFKDLNLRTDMGIGVGYQVWETKQRNLSLEAGLSYVNEDFVEAEDENFSAGRWAIDFNHLLWNSEVQFFHGHEGLVSIEDTNDLIIRSRTGLRMPIYKGLTSTIQVKWEWDNSPAEGQENSDTDYMFFIGYSF